MVNRYKINILTFIVIVSIASFFTYCKKDDEKEKKAPHSIELYTGNNQTSQISTKLANPVIVIVTDQFNKPYKDAVVHFSVGEGSLSTETSTTNAEGKASVNWTLGATEGEQVLTIKAYNADEVSPLAGSPMQVIANASPEPPIATSIELVSGDEQTAIQETALANPIEILVKDQYGNAFEGSTVDFVVTDGSVSSSTVTTDTNGKAFVEWTLGNKTGIQTLTISSFKSDGTTPLAGSPIEINATATAKLEASSIELLSGNGQTAEIEQLLPDLIEVVIKDQFGNAYQGATINVSVTEGNVSAQTLVSDTVGKASVNWTLGSTIGVQYLTISAFKSDGTTVLSGAPITISATAIAKAEATGFELLSGDGQTGEIEKLLSNPIRIEVKDQYGNVFEGAKVNFTVSVGNVSSENVTTGSEGIAETEWTLGADLGTQNLTVNVYKADGVTQLPGSPIGLSASAVGLIDYDGNIYNIVTIGGQVWMSENLKVKHYSNGDAIPNVTGNGSWANLGDNNTDKAYCFVNNDQNSVYGAMYTWAAAMNGQSSSATNPSNVQGVCPAGWHLPSAAEWAVLIDHVGGSSGSKLAGNESLWRNGAVDSNPNFGTSGFSALPGGIRSNANGYFINIRDVGGWWSTTEQNSTNTTIRGIYYQNNNMYSLNEKKSDGKSIRCVKD